MTSAHTTPAPITTREYLRRAFWVLDLVRPLVADADSVVLNELDAFLSESIRIRAEIDTEYHFRQQGVIAMPYTREEMDAVYMQDHWTRDEQVDIAITAKLALERCDRLSHLVRTAVELARHILRDAVNPDTSEQFDGWVAEADAIEVALRDERHAVHE